MVTHTTANQDINSFVKLCFSSSILPIESQYSRLAKESGWTSKYNVLKSFENWGAALLFAGFDAEAIKAEIHLRTCLGDLYTYTEECIRKCVYPSTANYARRANQEGWKSCATIIKTCHSWEDALQAIGFNLEEIHSNTKTRKILGDVYDFAQASLASGKYPGARQYISQSVSQGWVDRGTIIAVYGSWKNVLEAAGLNSAEIKNELSLQKILGDIYEFSQICLMDDKYPSYSEYIKLEKANGWKSSSAVINQCGSWEDALQAAGIDIGELNKHYADGIALKHVTKFVQASLALNQYPKAEHYHRSAKKQGWFNLVRITKIYGSWEAALIAAGFNLDELPKKHSSIPSEVSLGHVRQFVSECVSNNRYPSSFIYLRLSSERSWTNLVTLKKDFGSWDEAIKAAGFELESLPPKRPGERKN